MSSFSTSTPKGIYRKLSAKLVYMHYLLESSFQDPLVIGFGTESISIMKVTIFIYDFQHST